MEGCSSLSSSSFKKDKWSLAPKRMGVQFGLHTSQRRWTNLEHRGNLLLEKGGLSSVESARELSMTVVLGQGTTTGASSLPDPSDDLKEQNNVEKRHKDLFQSQHLEWPPH